MSKEDRLKLKPTPHQERPENSQINKYDVDNNKLCYYSI